MPFMTTGIYGTGTDTGTGMPFGNLIVYTGIRYSRYIYCILYGAGLGCGSHTQNYTTDSEEGCEPL
jgi:hypothetical protein